jgi:hypothetical protein
MNLLMGLSPKHYAITIIAALVGSAAAGRQAIEEASGSIKLDPNDVVMGIPLYYWALGVCIAGMLACAIMLLWTSSCCGVTMCPANPASAASSPQNSAWSAATLAAEFTFAT